MEPKEAGARWQSGVPRSRFLGGFFLSAPAPRCPWWDYIWSVRTSIRVGTDGCVPIGTQRLRIEKPPQTKVVLCLHPSGHHSVLAALPDHQQKPALFTDRPQ
jgi:hypothetical protein